MISAIVLSKNEENNIIDCIESIIWCDEIIVVDDYSEDRTIELIEKFNNPKVKVFKRKLNSNFSEQRNFGKELAKEGWVLFIDADERASEDLREEIKSRLMRPTDTKAYLLKRVDYIWGKKMEHGEIGDISFVRLAKKDSGDWKGKVHEVWDIKGKKEKLENPILHYPFRNISNFLSKINFYTSLRADELFKKKVKTNWFLIIIYPKAKFFMNYFVKLGFLDGEAGLIHAIIMSFHSFLVRGKLWLLWQKS